MLTAAGERQTLLILSRSARFKFLSAACTCLSVGVPVLVVAWIWLPAWWQFRYSVPPISEQQIEQSRNSPTDALLLELGQIKHLLSPPLGRLLDHAVSDAAEMLEILSAKSGAGEDTSGDPILHFDPDLLNDLEYASLVFPRVMLAAYAHSGDSRFFQAAHRFIFELADYEDQTWLPRGLLWNDHALASRCTTLSEFWRFYRRSDQYNSGDARKFLRLVALSAARLANPALYNFHTNHGTQQNLALMHLCLAFPDLPQFATYADLAIKRHNEHLHLIINKEGAVLEHSAGYHKMGVELLSIALRYTFLLERPIPRSWFDKYKMATHFYWQLRRPDGSLPRVGDTSAAEVEINPLRCDIDREGAVSPVYRSAGQRPYTGHTLCRAAGYAVHWTGRDRLDDDLSQTVVVWSHYPGMAHKHADELSVNLWTPEGNWWRNIGYWPPAHSNRADAVSWTGSTAPHLSDEPAASNRYSRLQSYASSASASAIDVERSGPGGFLVRRQVVQVPPDVWVILDWFADSNERPVRTVWGSEYDVDVCQGRIENSFILSRTDTNVQFIAHFMADPAARSRVVSASKNPFAGWVEENFRARGSTAIVIEQPPQASWAVNTTIRGRKDAPILQGPPQMLHSVSPETWSIRLPLSSGDLTINRNGARIQFDRDGEDWQIQLQTDFATPAAIENESRQAYANGMNQYGKVFSSATAYRSRMTWIFCLLLITQELFFGVGRFLFRRQVRILRIISVICWIGIGLWFHVVRFPL